MSTAILRGWEGGRGQPPEDSLQCWSVGGPGWGGLRPPWLQVSADSWAPVKAGKGPLRRGLTHTLGCRCTCRVGLKQKHLECPLGRRAAAHPGHSGEAVPSGGPALSRRLVLESLVSMSPPVGQQTTDPEFPTALRLEGGGAGGAAVGSSHTHPHPVCSPPSWGRARRSL